MHAQLTIAQKTGIALLLALLPVLFLLFKIYSLHNVTIQKLQHEVQGAKVMAELQTLQHKFDLAFRSNDAARISTVATALTNWADTPKPITLTQAEIDKLKILTSAVAAEPSPAHKAAFFEQIIWLINIAADTSSLVMDAHLGTYYLMDNLVFEIPLIVARMNNVSEPLYTLMRGEKLEPAAEQDLFVKKGEMSAAFDWLQKSYTISFANLPQDEHQQELKAQADAVIAQINTFSEMIATLTETEKTVNFDQYKAHESVLLASLQDLSLATTLNLQRFLKERMQDAQRDLIAATAISLSMLLLGVFATFWFMMKTVGVPLRTLTQNFRSNTETVLSELTENAQQALNASTRVWSASVETSELAAAVAQAAEDASVTVEDMAQSVQEIAQSSGNIAEEATSSANVALEARLYAKRAEETISNLSHMAAEIGSFIDLIKNIARQTNLLAMNAKVEAVHAGEFGRGFNVVAGEVKKLAGETATATTRISEQVSNVQQAVENTSALMANITDVLNRMAESATSIKTQIDSQGEITGRIGGSVDIAAAKAFEVSENILLVSQAAEQTQKISDFLKETQEANDQKTGSLYKNLKTFSGDLARFSG